MTVSRYVNGELVEVADDPRPTLAVRRPALLEKLAERRWQAEVGGVTIGEMAIRTDADTQRKVTAAYVKAQADDQFTVSNWKVAPGVFVALDNATILTIGDAVTDHVQVCFDNEAVLAAQILAANTHAALDAVDIESGWPG